MNNTLITIMSAAILSGCVSQNPNQRAIDEIEDKEDYVLDMDDYSEAMQLVHFATKERITKSKNLDWYDKQHGITNNTISKTTAFLGGLSGFIGGADATALFFSGSTGPTPFFYKNNAIVEIMTIDDISMENLASVREELHSNAQKLITDAYKSAGYETKIKTKVSRQGNEYKSVAPFDSEGIADCDVKKAVVPEEEIDKKAYDPDLAFGCYNNIGFNFTMSLYDNENGTYTLLNWTYVTPSFPFTHITNKSSNKTFYYRAPLGYLRTMISFPNYTAEQYQEFLNKKYMGLSPMVYDINKKEVMPFKRIKDNNNRLTME
ncbi:hypothetical protein N9R79_07110 [Vibrio sp.]|nr:hypothetical protein [Vibrio sp.]